MELLIAILVIVVIFIIPNIKVVPQARSYVIERLGSYLTTWNNGLHFKIPFVDRVSNKVSLKEIVKDFNDKGYIIGIENVEQLKDAIIKAKEFEPVKYKHNNEKMLKIIQDFIDK